ncbi:deoxycytidylate deaminase-like [Neoarius graeffei]|uniref:deoxycytidylate deaminase-like n=1 Tax=Neoarius graeffei TaxID=443677 RepID=UPI00298C502A|nr:deoxycytidylate deaminase-like [Neoarius graeffei]
MASKFMEKEKNSEPMPKKRTKVTGTSEDDRYFMALALLFSMKSPDPRTKVGACIVNEEGNIVGVGYNKMPSGCEDEFLKRQLWKHESPNPLEIKYPYVCHAELNAIMNKTSVDVKGCTIYVTLFPCNECAKAIIQSGIRGVVYLSNKYADSNESKASLTMLDTAGIPHRQFESKEEISALLKSAEALLKSIEPFAE